jgi:hypothetical protein
MPLPVSERAPERSYPRRVTGRTAGRAPAPSAELELARVEAMLRRLHGEPDRIDNPFAAFPTRSFWLGRLMNDRS